MKYVQTLAAMLAALILAGCHDTISDAPVASQAPVMTSATVTRSSVSAASYHTVVQQLYIAYFGRPADTGGLANFSANLAAMQGPTDIQDLTGAYSSSAQIRQLVDSFGSSAESAALYSGDTNAFVTAIYVNVLGRPPDTEGQAFWVNSIDNRGLTRANASLAIMAGALANQTTQGLLDAQLIQKRVAVGSNFTTALDTTTEAAAYSGNAAAASARAMLAAVTANTDVAAYQTTVDATISALVAAAAAGANSYAQVRDIINHRCIVCHSGGAPAGGISWVSDAAVHADASLIADVVSSHVMPQGNATNMTDAERVVIANWFAAGAP